MSSDEQTLEITGLERRGGSILCEIDGAEPASFSESFTQDLLACAVRLYSRRERIDSGASAFKPGEVTATEVARTVGPMLESVGLELFELSMWKGIGTP